jgi:hypothetical protein
MKLDELRSFYDGLEQYFRNVALKSETVSSFKSTLARAFSKVVPTLDISSDEDSFTNLDLDDLDLRIATNLIDAPLIFPRLGKKYDYIISKYYYILPKMLKNIYIYFVSLIPLYISETNLIKLLKDVGTYLTRLRLNQNYPMWLMFFEENHILSGYSTEMHKNAEVEELCEPFLQERQCPVEYDEIMKKYIKQTISYFSWNTYKMDFPTFFKYRDNIENTGSCDFGVPLTGQTEGFKQGFKTNSKTANMFYYDDPSAIREIYRWLGHLIRPFLKDNEPSKIRIVLAYDSRSYYRCTYLYKFIRDPNAYMKWTSVGFDPEQMWQVREDINNVITDRTYKNKLVCTDQSAFDQHVYKEHFIYAFKLICDEIVKRNPQAKDICDREMYGLENAYFQFGKRLRPWKNGLCSGHKFTALIGSIINRASTLTAIEISRIQNMIPQKYNFGYFQGDDAIISVRKDFNVDKFVDAYHLLGLEVNPMKTWVNHTRTEYLHQSYYQNCVVALPARGALSLIFGDPQSRPLGKDELFNNYVSNLSQAQRRGLVVEHIAKKFLSKFRFPKHEINNYLHTPTAYGGGGFVPFVSPSKMMASKIKKSQKYTPTTHITSHVGYSIPGIDIEKYILKRYSDYLPSPGIKTEIFLTPVEFAKSADHDIRTHIRLIPYKTAFDPNGSDNEERWLNHVRELMGYQAPFYYVDPSRYSRVRKVINTKINMINSKSNAFIPKEYEANFKEYGQYLFDLCLMRKIHLDVANRLVNTQIYKTIASFKTSAHLASRYLFAF